jgi:uroporphyrinogen decarboxylase
MDTRKLKKEFGKDITFWGGGVDTQKVLPNGTTKEIEEEVKKRIYDLAPGGGFVFATVHNIQPDVPPQNILSLLKAVKEHGKY